MPRTASSATSSPTQRDRVCENESRCGLTCLCILDEQDQATDRTLDPASHNHQEARLLAKNRLLEAHAARIEQDIHALWDEILQHSTCDGDLVRRAFTETRGTSRGRTTI